MKTATLAAASTFVFLLGSAAVMAQADSPVGNEPAGMTTTVPTGVEAPEALKTPGERAHDKFGQEIPRTAKTAPSGYQTGEAEKTPGEEARDQYKN